ncbi:hypothetical protein AB4090_00295 [Acidithiobacillus sp. IBUN Pt1247-S3]|uniref:tetratricopeptide repeat protein n=1 Tax=Acidithiobacillus sp. IBUN Pt1247-S3 TaxID=3166642 RepID=UPI0034E3C232
MAHPIVFRFTQLAVLLSLATGSATALAAEPAKTTPAKPAAETTPTVHPAAPTKKPVPVKKAAPVQKVAPAKAAPKVKNATIEALVNQTRAAYWHGNIAGAIAGYQKLIKQHPQPRWYGELGNVYLQKGRPRQAAENYYHAARALIAAGRPLEAGALLPTLQRLDPPLAAKLLASESHHKEPH